MIKKVYELAKKVILDGKVYKYNKSKKAIKKFFLENREDTIAIEDIVNKFKFDYFDVVDILDELKNEGFFFEYDENLKYQLMKMN